MEYFAIHWETNILCNNIKRKKYIYIYICKFLNTFDIKKG